MISVPNQSVSGASEAELNWIAKESSERSSVELHENFLSEFDSVEENLEEFKEMDEQILNEFLLFRKTVCFQRING